jgi:hypothetical protein
VTDSGASSHPDPVIRRAVRVLRMVHELHKRGYQRLRIVPGIAPSGLFWRVGVYPVTSILRRNGAMCRDWEERAAHYTTGAENNYFDWTDARRDTARELADKFLERFCDLARSGEGRDWAFAGWYVEMLGVAETGALPISYEEYWTDPPEGMMRTTHERILLPAPPPGEAEEARG